MTLDTFIQKNNGKPLNFDGNYGNQCVDLFRFYCKDVLKVPQFPSVNGAKNLWDVCPPTFTKIRNLPWNVPQKGDIIIFGGKFGHVSIFIDGNVFVFRSFDQNYPSQGYYDSKGNFIGTGVAHVQGHNYLNPAVIGWLRKK